jgi:DNA-binding response OmpR family regulator
MSTEQAWPASEAGPLRVLLVEDEELMRSIISQLLRAEGYEVIEAHAAEVALSIFEKQKIDVAVLDLNLGHGGNGLELLGKIRDLDPEVMGIILTAYASAPTIT